METTAFIAPTTCSSSVLPSEASNDRDITHERFSAGRRAYDELPADLRPQKRGLLGKISRWKWKQIFIVITLWVGYLSVSTAFSTIAPFFPNEVSECAAKLDNNYFIDIYG